MIEDLTASNSDAGDRRRGTRRVVACVAAAAVGIGLVTFNTHAVPRFLAASPPGGRVRLQAVLGLTVTVPVLLLSSLYGLIAQLASPAWALTAATTWTLTAASIMATVHPWIDSEKAATAPR